MTTEIARHVFVPNGPHTGLTERTCASCGQPFTSRVHRAPGIADLPANLQLAVEHMPDKHGVMFLSEYDLVVTWEKGGPVAHCIKCFAYEMHLVGAGMAPEYSHQFLHPTRVLHWNMALAHQLVATYPNPPGRLHRPWLEQWIARRSNLIAGHIDHIPEGHLDDPVLCDITYVESLLEKESGRKVPLSSPFRMLLDGHHRAARKLRDGQDVFGHVLRPWDHARVVREELGAYNPELLGWLTREQAERLPMVQSPPNGMIGP